MTIKIGILVVGNEILDGLVLDTNSQWIINRSKTFNLQVLEKMTVRDEVSEIEKGIKRMITDGCKIIFTTGGLGPTHDDKTLNGIAKAFGLPLVINNDALNIVTRQYSDFHSQGIIDSPKITDSRKKMAFQPKGSIPLDNRVGSAPGVLLCVEDVKIISLPGVPKELSWIYDNEILPILKEIVQDAFAEEVIHIQLKDESTLAPIIDEVMKEVPGVYVKSMVKPYGESGIRLWISTAHPIKSEAEKLVKKVTELIIRKCNDKLPNG